MRSEKKHIKKLYTYFFFDFSKRHTNLCGHEQAFVLRAEKERGREETKNFSFIPCIVRQFWELRQKIYL